MRDSSVVKLFTGSLDEIYGENFTENLLAVLQVWRRVLEEASFGKGVGFSIW